MKRITVALIAISLAFSLCACGSVQQLQPSANVNTPARAPAAATPKPTPTPAPAAGDSIRADFKATMDSYEVFFDEYVEFMQAYAQNPSDVGLMLKYANFLSKYADTMEALEGWEDRDLNSAELAYYIEVTARIETKLLRALG